MSNPKEIWRNKKTDTTYEVYSPYKIRVSDPNKGKSTINQVEFNRRKNGK